MHRVITTRVLRALTLAGFAAALAGPAPAFDVEEPDPTDLVPGYFSAETFAKLDKYDLYDVTLALKRGRNILLANCTPSQSREIFEASQASGAPATDLLRSTCSG